MIRVLLPAVALWVGSAILLFVSIIVVAVLVGPTISGGERGVVILLGVGGVVTLLSIVAFARMAAPQVQGTPYIVALVLFAIAQLLLLPPYFLMVLVSLNR